MSGKLIAKETITKTLERGDLILGRGQFYSKDGIKTQLNNNVLVVGTSGAGKTAGGRFQHFGGILWKAC